MQRWIFSAVAAAILTSSLLSHAQTRQNPLPVKNSQKRAHAKGGKHHHKKHHHKKQTA